MLMLFTVLVCGGVAYAQIGEDAGQGIPTWSQTEIVFMETAPTDTTQQSSVMEGDKSTERLVPGPAGRDGASGQTGPTGSRGAQGTRGTRGSTGPPGKDADPRIVARLVLAELERSQRGEAVDGWAKPFLDALIAEKLVVGYPDGTIRPKEKPDFQRVVTVVGRVQQQLRAEIKAAQDQANSYTDEQVGIEREQRIAADAKKGKDTKRMIEGIIGGVIGVAVTLLVAYLIWGRRPRQAGPNEDYTGQLATERDALAEPDPGDAVTGSLVFQRTSRYQRDENGRLCGINRRVVRPAVFPQSGTSATGPVAASEAGPGVVIIMATPQSTKSKESAKTEPPDEEKPKTSAKPKPAAKPTAKPAPSPAPK